MIGRTSFNVETNLRDIVEPNFISNATFLENFFVLMPNNARPHVAYYVRAILEKTHIECMRSTKGKVLARYLQWI